MKRPGQSSSLVILSLDLLRKLMKVLLMPGYKKNITLLLPIQIQTSADDKPSNLFQNVFIFKNIKLVVEQFYQLMRERTFHICSAPYFYTQNILHFVDIEGLSFLALCAGEITL